MRHKVGHMGVCKSDGRTDRQNDARCCVVCSDVAHGCGLGVGGREPRVIVFFLVKSQYTGRSKFDTAGNGS